MLPLAELLNPKVAGILVITSQAKALVGQL
jgi:hypothetical protein